MVSLARVRHNNIFSDNCEVLEDEQVLTSGDAQSCLQPVIGERPKPYGCVNTVWAASILLISGVLLGAFDVTIAVIWPFPSDQDCQSYFWALYFHGIFWSLSFVTDVYLRRRHTDSRIEGYLEFYTDTVVLSRAPYYISTLCNAALLIISVLVHQHYPDMSLHCKGSILDPLHYVSAIILLEVVAIVGVLVAYIVKVRKFNIQKNRPDALRDEWMASFIRDSYSGGEIGYRERDNNTQELLEKQADLLRYLKEQNSRLVQKVMILSLQVQERHSPSIT